MALWQILGDLHPKLVQFPLVLLLAGLAFDAGGLLAHSPRETHFLVRFSKHGRPVNDLEPYIGAMAHGLFLSGGLEHLPALPPRTAHRPRPRSAQRTRRPVRDVLPPSRPVQAVGSVQASGKTGFVSYVIDVQSPVLPASVMRFFVDD